MKNSKLSFLLAALLMISVWSCDNDDPEPVNEEEVITTVNVTFTSLADNSTITASFRDLDGEGGNAPVITNPGAFTAGASYSVSIEILNETETPAEDVTEEIEEEDDEHQLFYIATGADLTFTYGDQDGEGNPLGLEGTLAAGDASTGTLRVVLLHEPNKGAAGVSGGDPANAGGETDFDISFNVTIQ